MRWSLEIKRKCFFSKTSFFLLKILYFFTGRVIKRDIMKQFNTEVEAKNVFVVKIYRTKDYSKYRTPKVNLS